MKKGEICYLLCKPEYAYGSAGSAPKIPSNATLFFEASNAGEPASSLPFCLASQLRNKKKIKLLTIIIKKKQSPNNKKNPQQEKKKTTSQLGFLKRVPLLQELLPGLSQKCVSELEGWD